MAIINHLNDTPLEMELDTCIKCHKIFRCIETEQTPGFRDMDYKCCPYCKEILASSMEYEFMCFKLSEDEIEYLKHKGIKIDNTEANGE